MGQNDFSSAAGPRLLNDIALLCDTKAGLSAVVGPLCDLIRAYADVASVAFFWVDATGRPTGFYHDCAPASLKDLFVTRFDELFSGPDEVNMLAVMFADGVSSHRNPLFMGYKIIRRLRRSEAIEALGTVAKRYCTLQLSRAQPPKAVRLVAAASGMTLLSGRN